MMLNIDVNDVKENGFIDKVGVRNYPFQPERHEELSVSKIFPQIVTIYSMGLCPTGEVLVTIDGNDGKKAVRLPKSDRVSIWADEVIKLMISQPEYEQFPCKLKVEYNSFINDYMALLLTN